MLGRCASKNLPRTQARILDAIVHAGELNDTGRGIAFVVPVDKVAGVAHFMKLADSGR